MRKFKISLEAIFLIATLLVIVLITSHTEAKAQETPHPTSAATATAAAVKRSASARARFVKQNTCPATAPAANGTSTTTGCAGFVVDHIRPLCSGGADNAGNMQWQTEVKAKKKDLEEFKVCALVRQGKIDPRTTDLCPSLTRQTFPILYNALQCNPIVITSTK